MALTLTPPYSAFVDNTCAPQVIQIAGGIAPYTAVSSNTSIATVSAVTVGPNLYSNSDSLSDTTLSGGLAINPTGSPSGHASAEVTGTGGAQSPVFQKNVSVAIGSSETLSAFVDLSNVTAAANRLIGFSDVTGFGTFSTVQPPLGTATRQSLTYTFAQNLVADDLSLWTKVNSPTTGTVRGAPGVNLTSGTQTATSPAMAVTAGSKISLGCLYAGGSVSAGTVLVSFLDQTGALIPGTGFSSGSGFSRKVLANVTVPAGVTSIRIKVDGNGATISGTYSICGFTIVNGAVGAGAWLSPMTPVALAFVQFVSATITSGQKFKISEPMLRTDGVAGPYSNVAGSFTLYPVATGSASYTVTDSTP